MLKKKKYKLEYHFSAVIVTSIAGGKANCNPQNQLKSQQQRLQKLQKEHECQLQGQHQGLLKAQMRL